MAAVIQRSGPSFRCKVFVSSCRNILKHEDLEGKINTACLGSLLLEDRLDQLEDQYLTHKEVKTSRLMVLVSAGLVYIVFTS